MSTAPEECLITGCDLIDAEGHTFRGDLFRMRGTNVMMFNATTNALGEPVVQVGALGDKFVEPADYWARRGVFLFYEKEAGMSKAAQDYLKPWTRAIP